jgi:hypothetical protein
MIPDPRRDPAVTIWLSQLEPRERYVMTLAISYAAGRLQHDPDWQQRVACARRELNPTREEETDLVAEAGRVAGRIAEERRPGSA